jgi:hypothetical protein
VSRDRNPQEKNQLGKCVYFLLHDKTCYKWPISVFLSRRKKTIADLGGNVKTINFESLGSNLLIKGNSGTQISRLISFNVRVVNVVGSGSLKFVVRKVIYVRKFVDRRVFAQGKFVVLKKFLHTKNARRKFFARGNFCIEKRCMKF